MTQAPPQTWLDLSSPLVRGLMPDAFLYSTVALIVAAPLAGVSLASSPCLGAPLASLQDDARRDGALAGLRDDAQRSGAPRRALQSAVRAAVRTSWPLVVAAVAFACSSAAVGLVLGGWAGGVIPVLARSHGALAAVGLGLALFGAVCGARFLDSLDAAAASLAAVGCLSCSVLVAGSGVANLPRTLVEWALTASPLVAVASAAHIDLTRTDTLYQISPLAHLQVDLPTWPVVCGVYLTAALTCFLGLTWLNRHPPLRSRTERTFA
jgi:hypothetical protein